MAIEVSNDMLKILLERSSVSSPTRSVINKFIIGKSQTTPLVTDTDLDDKVEFDVGTGDYKDFESGFPSLDADKMELNFRGVVSDTQGNSETLDGVGVVNGDATKLLGLCGKFTGIAKTTSKRIIFRLQIKARQRIEVN